MVLFLALLGTTGLAESKPLGHTTDQELKRLCFDWFTPTYLDESGLKIKRHPECRRELEAFPRQELLQRLRGLCMRPIHAADFSAIHFVLAYWGDTPAEDARRMILPDDLGKDMPSHVDKDRRSAPYRWFRECSAEMHPGLYDSVIQLYQKRGSVAMMKVFLNWGTDGGATYGWAALQRSLFRAAPYDYVAAAERRNARQDAAWKLSIEGTKSEYVEMTKILDRIRADKGSGLSQSANLMRYYMDRVKDDFF